MEPEDSNLCTVCKVELRLHSFNIEGIENLPYPLNPQSTGTCSTECHNNHLRCNGAYRMSQNLKNWTNKSFEEWNEIFQFPVEGGYAEKRYQMMRTRPMQFLFTLDIPHLVRLTIGNKE